MKLFKTLAALIIIVALAMQTFGVINVSAQNYITGNYEGKFEYIITNKEVTITNINKNITDLKIPTKIEGYPVTKIGDSACENGKIRNITFPKTLKIIGNKAFEGCSGLNEIILPESVRYVMDYAFGDMLHMGSPEKIELNEGLLYIGANAFSYMFWDISTITIPESVQYIGKMAFYDDRLKSVYIMGMNTQIESVAFYRQDFWGTSATIYGYENSAASYYAVNENYHFESLGKFTGVHKAWSNVYGYKNSKLASGKHTFDGHLYWFNKYGQAYKGLVPMTNGDIYYFSKKEKDMGQALTGWVKIGDKKYYFLSSGDNKYKAAKGWMKIKGEKYYFYSDGTMATGKTTIKGKKYEFDKNGKLIS